LAAVAHRDTGQFWWWQQSDRRSASSSFKPLAVRRQQPDTVRVVGHALLTADVDRFLVEIDGDRPTPA
jgi:hypothetical protein